MRNQLKKRWGVQEERKNNGEGNIEKKRWWGKNVHIGFRKKTRWRRGGGVTKKKKGARRGQITLTSPSLRSRGGNNGKSNSVG